MKGLQTTRVLVLDDDMEEARPFMEALAKRSIGCIYFRGDDESKLPSEEDRLTGIRLAALDLDLGIGGEAGRVIDMLVETLNKIIHKGNGPYLAIAWTSKDDTYFEEFRNRQSDLDCHPVGLIKMQKTDDADIDTIFTKIEASMEEAYPLGLLSYWEGIIHESSGSVMQVLPVAVDWEKQSQQALRLILDHAATSHEHAVPQLAALVSTFNALQLDSLDSYIASITEEDAYVLVSPLGSLSGESTDELDLKAKLNFRLLCTEPASDTAPGNIYDCDNICLQGTTPFPTLDQLLDDMVRSKQSVDEDKKQLKAAGCLAIAMEITPLCDYQQNNVKLARFVCGVAIPYEKKNCAKRPEGFLKSDKAPIEFDLGNLTGKKLLVWNSRYIVSVPSSAVNSEASLVRLRQSPLIDIQAWLASQLNRPGYLSLTAPWS